MTGSLVTAHGLAGSCGPVRVGAGAGLGGGAGAGEGAAVGAGAGDGIGIGAGLCPRERPRPLPARPLTILNSARLTSRPQLTRTVAGPAPAFFGAVKRI